MEQEQVTYQVFNIKALENYNNPKVQTDPVWGHVSHYAEAKDAADLLYGWVIKNVGTLMPKEKWVQKDTPYYLITEVVFVYESEFIAGKRKELGITEEDFAKVNIKTAIIEPFTPKKEVIESVKRDVEARRAEKGVTKIGSYKFKKKLGKHGARTSGEKKLQDTIGVQSKKKEGKQ